MKLRIFKDASQVTYGYDLDSEDDKIGIVLTSDAYESPDAIINDLKMLSKAISDGLNNIEGEKSC